MRKTALVGLCILLAILFFVDINTGSTSINTLKGLSDLATGIESNEQEILYNLRLPKAITAMLTGASLSLCGVLMQTTFRNPLAGPYVLGVSSGASLGVAITTMLSSSLGYSIYALGNFSIAISAIIGAAIILSVIVLLSERLNDHTTLLIIGVLFSSLASAIINLIQSISNPDSLKLFINWTMGSLDTTNWSQLYYIIPTVMFCSLCSFFLCKQLDISLLGDESAQTIGISVKRTRNISITITCILAGTITAFTGPIGFIGIAVPHLVRNLFKTSKHIIVIPGSFLCGAVLLLACDTICHIPHNGYVLPINAVCAIVGAPVVTLIILKNRKR